MWKKLPSMHTHRGNQKLNAAEGQCFDRERWGWREGDVSALLDLEPGKAGAQLRAATPAICSATAPLSHRTEYF